MNRLPQSACAAWQAYNAMTTTKQRHIDYLKMLEARYSKYGEPTAEESALLARLLDEHDAQVKAFLGAMNALREHDTTAHKTLIEYITLLGDLFTPDGEHADSPTH